MLYQPEWLKISPRAEGLYWACGMITHMIWISLCDILFILHSNIKIFVLCAYGYLLQQNIRVSVSNKHYICLSSKSYKVIYKRTFYVVNNSFDNTFSFFRESWIRHTDKASQLYLETEKKKRDKLYNCKYYCLTCKLI